jgi:hypothetical protein
MLSVLLTIPLIGPSYMQNTLLTWLLNKLFIQWHTYASILVRSHHIYTHVLMLIVICIVNHGR